MVSLGKVLCPEPPRVIPAHRLLGVALRTAHLMTFGTLVGGHLFEVDHWRLFPFLVATILSGAGLTALEMASTCAWLFMGKGLAVLAKLLLLASIPLLWEHRVVLLLLTVALASVGAHMPARFRHYSPLFGKVEEPERDAASEVMPRE